MIPDLPQTQTIIFWIVAFCLAGAAFAVHPIACLVIVVGISVERFAEFIYQADQPKCRTTEHLKATTGPPPLKTKEISVLFDPKWEVQTRPDVFSLESLIAWLEKQPADREYNYSCNGHCLLAQYFGANGYENVQMFTDRFDYAGGPTRFLPRFFNAIALDDCTVFHWPSGKDEFDYTFGAALARARKALVQ